MNKNVNSRSRRSIGEKTIEMTLVLYIFIVPIIPKLDDDPKNKDTSYKLSKSQLKFSESYPQKTRKKLAQFQFFQPELSKSQLKFSKSYPQKTQKKLAHFQFFQPELSKSQLKFSKSQLKFSKSYPQKTLKVIYFSVKVIHHSVKLSIVQ